MKLKHPHLLDPPTSSSSNILRSSSRNKKPVHNGGQDETPDENTPAKRTPQEGDLKKQFEVYSKLNRQQSFVAAALLHFEDLNSAIISRMNHSAWEDYSQNGCDVKSGQPKGFKVF